MWIAALEVAIGLGFVIFVHELGHFAVAKMCGVKVDKFFIGFDIGGLKLCSFRWGETLYGIGILPLGGYVKMLGQEDNPAQLRKEMERAKLRRPARSSGSATETASGAEHCRQSARETASIGGEAAFRSAQLPGEERSPADGHHFGGRDHEHDLRVGLRGRRVPRWREANSDGRGRRGCGRRRMASGMQADDKILEVAGRKVHQWRQMTDEIHNGDMRRESPCSSSGRASRIRWKSS